jgi:hypothetical protein
MDCQSCNDLLAAYRHSVNLFKAAVQKGSGAMGDDSRLIAEEAKRLGQQCRDASDIFMEHWRKDHKALGPKAGS